MTDEPTANGPNRALLQQLQTCSTGDKECWEASVSEVETLTNVDGDVAGVDAPLVLAHLRVVPPPSEQPWRLHPEIAHLITSDMV